MSGTGGTEKIDPVPVSAVENLGIDRVYIEYARQFLNPIMADGCFDKFINFDFNDGTVTRELSILNRKSCNYKI